MAPLGTIIEEAKKFNVKGSIVVALLTIEFFVVSEYWAFQDLKKDLIYQQELHARDTEYEHSRTNRVAEHKAAEAVKDLKIEMLEKQLENCKTDE